MMARGRPRLRKSAVRDVASYVSTICSSWFSTTVLGNAKKARSAWTGEGARPYIHEQLDVQILHIQRIIFDELASRLDVFAHERSEDGFALGNILELY